jgi:hypothetical protein
MMNSRLYHAVNRMMRHLGAEGEITTRNELVSDVMDALAEIDGGTYTPPNPAANAADKEVM